MNWKDQVFSFLTVFLFFISEPPSDGRILFRKPTKRSNDEGQLEVAKKSKGDERLHRKDKKDKKKGKQKASLLSFNEDDEEEEEG